MSAANSSEQKLSQQLLFMGPVMESSLDPLCVVNDRNEIVFMNFAMKSFLGIRGRDVKKKQVFCDVLKLSSCQPTCQIEQVLQEGVALRLDEAPAVKKNKKLRVLLKASPILDVNGAEPGKAIGAVITVRETTGEILLHAKYHKLLKTLEEQTLEVDLLKDRIAQLTKTLRNARGSTIV